MAGDVAAGVETHPAWPADRRLHVGLGEAHAFGRDPVEVGGVQMRVTGAAQVVEAQLVAVVSVDSTWAERARRALDAMVRKSMEMRVVAAVPP